jgi:hypothetical protein
LRGREAPTSAPEVAVRVTHRWQMDLGGGAWSRARAMRRNGLASGFALEVGSTAAGPGALPRAHEAQRAGQALAWWGAGGFRAREGVAPFEGPPGHPLLGGHLGVVPEGCHPPGGPRRGAPSWSSPSSSHLPGRRAWARAGPCCAVGGPAGLGTHGRVTPEAVDGVAPGWGWDVVRGRRGVRL